LELRRAGLQLIQTDPHQSKSVSVKDVEVVAAVYQHFGESRIADDGVDDQRVLARIGDAVRVVLAAEGDGLL
jgi:hypothetical protein